MRKIPPFEFENWAVIALGGIPNKTQVGDMGIDGRIYPANASPEKRSKDTGHLDFMDTWHPVQVKQKDKVGRAVLCLRQCTGSQARESCTVPFAAHSLTSILKSIGRLPTEIS